MVLGGTLFLNEVEAMAKPGSDRLEVRAIWLSYNLPCTSSGSVTMSSAAPAIAVLMSPGLKPCS
jgi:hypothetical protein